MLVALTAVRPSRENRYGDAGYPVIYDRLDGAGQKWLDHHAELAETWLPVLIATAALAALAIVVGAWRRPLLPWAALLVAVVTLSRNWRRERGCKGGRSDPAYGVPGG